MHLLFGYREVLAACQPERIDVLGCCGEVNLDRVFSFAALGATKLRSLGRPVAPGHIVPVYCVRGDRRREKRAHKFAKLSLSFSY
jgi:hypothetical protein